ncbi:MAG: hypothetical protein LBR16_04160 [Treponema sp.]|jgi:hypothetical protein|nr:hypothetical protein [Treponema sp.]
MNRLTAAFWKQSAWSRLLAACLGAAVFGLFLLAALEPFRSIDAAGERPLSDASYTCDDAQVDCLAVAEYLHSNAAAFRADTQRQCASPGTQALAGTLTKSPLFAVDTFPSLHAGNGTPFKLRI